MAVSVKRLMEISNKEWKDKLDNYIHVIGEEHGLIQSYCKTLGDIYEEQTIDSGNAGGRLMKSKAKKFENDVNIDIKKVSEGARNIITSPNAGGSSSISEGLSYQLLHQFLRADLQHMEKEIPYKKQKNGNRKMDYTCRISNILIAVSVTRAMEYDSEFTLKVAKNLLSNKLKGIVIATENSDDEWKKRILHIWAKNSEASDLIKRAYEEMRLDLTSNTFVLVTTVDNNEDQNTIFSVSTNHCQEPSRCKRKQPEPSQGKKKNKK